MRARDPEIDRQPVVYAKRSHGHGGLSFLTMLALLLSLLSLGISGYLAYRLLNLQQAFGTVNEAINRDASPRTSPNPEPSVNQPVSPSPQNGSPTATGTVIQPGQFAQPAIDNKAQVELVAVNRIQNPNTGLRDFVNIQFRVKRTAPQNQAIDYSRGVIFPGETTARNPSSGETYEAVDRMRWATSNVAVSDLKAGATADAYVWMQIPETVNQIDVLIPKTQAFKNVPIAN